MRVSPRTSWLKTREVMSQARTTAVIAAAFSAANDATRASAIVEGCRGAEEPAIDQHSVGYSPDQYSARSALSGPIVAAIAHLARAGFSRSTPYDSPVQTCSSTTTLYVPTLSPCATSGGQRRVEKRRPPSLARLLRKERKRPNSKGPVVWLRR